VTRSVVAALALGLALTSGACKKQRKAPKAEPVETMSADEVKRSEDACKAYVERVCSCAATVPAAVDACTKAKAQPEAIKLALEVAASPDSKPVVVRQSLDGVRKIVKACIEQTAQLPALGCP
jgi:hypothetical protein